MFEKCERFGKLKIYNVYEQTKKKIRTTTRRKTDELTYRPSKTSDQHRADWPETLLAA